MIDWDAIVAGEGPLVWQTLWRLLGQRADVEECFQETFLAALKLSQKEEVKAWPAVLCRLATARAMDRLRQRYRRSEQTIFEVRTQGESQQKGAVSAACPVSEAVTAELTDRLRQALSQLPESQAEAFSLFILSGWTHAEIAERLAMTENAVGVLIHRARLRLRELLESCR